MTSAPRRYRTLGLSIGITFTCSLLAGEISLQDAVDRVQNETQGKVLSAQTLQVGHRKIYRIKVLTASGQVRVVEVKANQ